MIALADTNILLRHANTLDPAHAIVIRAVRVLQSLGIRPRIVPQNIYEFWVVATRPVANNGLGLTTVECERTLIQVEAAFPLLPDKIDLLSEWRKLVLAQDCKGKIAHDARLVAAMKTYGITSILTFNVVDFARHPGLTILNPTAIAGAPLPP